MLAPEKLIDLVEKTLSEFDSLDFRTSRVIRKAIRIARLRNDFDNLWWMEMEMATLDNKDAQRRIKEEIQPHYSKAHFQKLNLQIAKAYLDERKVRKMDQSGNITEGEALCILAIPEIERRVETLFDEAEKAMPPKGLNPFDLYFVEQQKSQIRAMLKIGADDMHSILANITQRVHNFLSVTEKQLLFGQLNSDIFERNRQYVEGRLHDIAPAVLEQLTTAYRRLSEGDLESRSHALTSCRRILKSLSDHVNPASNREIVGIDGKKRKMSDEKYIARLWQFVADKVGSTTSGELLLTQINDFGNRIDRIYNLSCRGVHDSVSKFEVNQCVIQTYILLGDILRLADEDSSIGVKIENEDMKK